MMRAFLLGLSLLTATPAIAQPNAQDPPPSKPAYTPIPCGPMAPRFSRAPP
jgi:hypothetical protein